MGTAASSVPSQALEMLLEQRGHEFSRRPSLEFDIDLLECDQDLPTVLQQLRDLPDASLLLQGPSGTGKTAFAQHVAEVLGKEMHQFLASDILGRYVGETEQNIAAAFRRARGGVLFLDEADSFLSSREFATHLWEISAVNELLQQMDSFRGTLIMATNLVRTLDSAVFRRFDWILAFAIPSRQRQGRILGHLVRSLPLQTEDFDLRILLDKMSPISLAVANNVLRRLQRRSDLDTRIITDTLVATCLASTYTCSRKVGF